VKESGNTMLGIVLENQDDSAAGLAKRASFSC